VQRLLTSNDFAYLVDFGIAHAGGDSGLTMTGAAIGSCAYMVPERFTGGQVGPRVDVYALTCLLHEMPHRQAALPGERLRSADERPHAAPGEVCRSGHIPLVQACRTGAGLAAAAAVTVGAAAIAAAAAPAANSGTM